MKYNEYVYAPEIAFNDEWQSGQEWRVYMERTGNLAQDTIQQLIVRATEARKKSYSPYSHYQVGAALLAKDGQIITGCNIENAAYGPTNCAERTAFFKAVNEGIRGFQAIAIVGSPEGDAVVQYAYPCGVCRQVMMEFCHPAVFQVIVARSVDDYRVMSLRELLPEGFGPENLNDMIERL